MAAPQTDEISKTIAQLTTDTIRDSLKQAKRKSQGNKAILVKNYETAVLDVGIEVFIARLSADLIATSAKAVELDESKLGPNQTLKQGLTELVQTKGLSSMLGKADEDLLKKFNQALGLEVEDTTDAAKKIADEVMLVGMEGFLKKLSQAILKKHCDELKLPKSGTAGNLVERLMVHIFELEPLVNDGKTTTNTTTTTTTPPAKEEAKPKETKKRKAEPKAKKEKATKAEPKAPKEKADGRPKRAASNKRKAEDEEDDEEEKEEKPAKKARKASTTKKDKKGDEKQEEKEDKKEKKEKKTRTPWVAPALSTIVKGKYSAADLHNKFNLTHLQDYCKQEGLKSHGQKKILIKTIIHYLETGEKQLGDVKKKGPGKPKKAKSKTTKKTAGSKKKASKDDKPENTASTSGNSEETKA